MDVNRANIITISGCCRSRRVLDYPALWERIIDSSETQGDCDISKRICTLFQTSKLHSSADNQGNNTVYYISSNDACKDIISLQNESDWPKRVFKSHRGLLKPVKGALFRFKVENRSEFLEAFITDWSPFPAACALAISKEHSLAVQVPDNNHDGFLFTGHFARHPLNGTLMPIWAVDWVKPEFGTGVVIINPAHNEQDLAFARKVGLPIRVALRPSDLPEGEWPFLPIKKEGVAVGTGIADGRPADEAACIYLERLKKTGSAVDHVHFNKTKTPIGKFNTCEGGEAVFCASCNVLAPFKSNDDKSCKTCGNLLIRCEVVLDDWVQQIIAVDEQANILLICDKKAEEETLLAARLLYYDLFEKPLSPQLLQIVEEVEGKEIVGLTDKEANVLMLSRPCDQKVNANKNAYEQVKSFVKNHHQVIEAFSESSELPPNPDDYRRELDLVFEGKFEEVFNRLRDIQKKLKATDKESVDLRMLSSYKFLVSKMFNI